MHCIQGLESNVDLEDAEGRASISPVSGGQIELHALPPHAPGDMSSDNTNEPAFDYVTNPLAAAAAAENRTGSPPKDGEGEETKEAI